MNDNLPAPDPMLQAWAHTQPEPIQTALASAGSFSALAGYSVSTLLQQHPDLHIADARLLINTSRSLAIAVKRALRTQQVTGSSPRVFTTGHGLFALSSGPTYQGEFPTDFDMLALPGAIEASTSPVAYLRALFNKARALEQRGASQDFKLLLAQRRPDLPRTLIGPTTLTADVSTLSLVNEVLEHSIHAYLVETGEPPRVDDALANTRFPLLLPYERWQAQINALLDQSEEKLTLGDIGRRVDVNYPYFIRQGAHSSRSDSAMQQSSGLGPQRRALLIEAPYFGAQSTADTPVSRSDPRTGRLAGDLQEEQANFYQRNFGVPNLDELQRSDIFLQATATPRLDLDALLATETQAPFTSANVHTVPANVDGAGFGAMFINVGSLPSITLQTLQSDSEPESQALPTHWLINLTPDRVDRANRMIRLSRWLELPYPAADRLVCAAIEAERREGVSPWMSLNTLRALGVFQDLRRKFGVSAEDFAAWLGEVSPYGLGEQPSQFDRIFNARSLFATPLVLDDSPFDIHPADEPGRQTVQQICAALGLSQEAFRYMARLIATAMQSEQLTRSLAVVSAFYRLTSLASYLKLHPITLIALAEVLDVGGNTLVRQLAGIPLNASFQVHGYADVLNTLVAVTHCVQWCREHEIEVIWLIQQLREPQVISTDAETKLLNELNTRLEPVRITRTTLLEAGVPSSITLPPSQDLPDQVDITPHWLCRLRDLVDLNGIVKDDVATAEDAYAESARNIIADMLDSLYQGHPDPQCEEHTQVRGDSPRQPRMRAPLDQEKQDLLETLLAVILRARAAQRAVAQESLADYMAISAERVLPLIYWARYSVYTLLAEARTVDLAGGTSNLRRLTGLRGVLNNDESSAEGDVFKGLLIELTRLRRLAGISEQFQLDAGMLQNHSSTWGQDWFGFPAGEINLHTLYYLSLYQRLVHAAEQSPDKLLHYLWLVNDPELFSNDSPPSEDQLRLVRDAAAGKVAELVGWSASEVLEVALTINDYGIIFSLVEFDTLLHCQALCKQVGVSARSILELGGLTLQSTDEDYRDAAQNALSCLTDQALTSERGPVTELGQSVTTASVVSLERLVAGDPAKDNVAEITLTIKDLSGKRLQGIATRWEVQGAGSLHQRLTFTDEDGVTSVQLHPGVIMGVARVSATIGLDQTVLAPPVLIDCHEPSVTVYNISQREDLPPRKPLAGEKQQVEFFAQLLDLWDNAAADRLVKFSTDNGRLLATDVHTDRQGFARVRLVSRHEEKCIVTVQYGNRITQMPSIEFVDRPSLDSVNHKIRVASSHVVGHPITLTCRLLGLWGDPAVGKEIEWFIDGQSQQTAETDAQGVATLTFAAQAAGPVQVRAAYSQGASDGEEADVLERTLDILSGPRMVRVSTQNPIAVAAVGQVLPITVRVDAEQEYAPPQSGNKPVAHYPVLWQGDQVQLSDARGYSEWPFALDTPGDYQLTATLGEQSLSFDIKVIPTPQWRFIVNDQAASPQTALTFRQGQRYQLHIQPAAGQQQLHNENVLLTWSGPNIIGLGVRSTPMFGQVLRMPESGLTWDIQCNGKQAAQFALGIRLDDMAHVTWLTINLLEAQGSLPSRNLRGDQ